MNTLLQDMRYALRMLAKSPGFTAIAVLTLALGIGANTAIFSVVNAVLLEPLPFKNPEQLVSLRETESAPGTFPLDGADYLDWEAQNKTFSSMSLYTYQLALSYSASGQGDAESIAAVRTEANFFQTMGAQPFVGRTFAKGEDVKGKDHVAILSYPFWKRRFDAEASALGKTIELNSEQYTVIGVMPAWFNFPAATDIWIPEDMTMPIVHNRGSHWANAVGRVKDGFTIEQARADLLTVSARINKAFRGPSDQDIHSLAFPLKDRLVGNSRPQLLLLLGAVALVLLVACANIANLLLARSTTRVREMAVRAALGAGKWRIARQLLTESVLLSLAGATVGFLGAWWGVSLLQHAQTSPIPRVNPVQVNLMVLLFAIGVSLVVGVLFGLAPALQSSDVNLSEELKASGNAVAGGSSGGRALRNSLIVAEIAVSLALLIGAGLLLRSFARMRSADIGIDPHNVLTMQMNLPQTKYPTAQARAIFYDQLLSRAAQIPGVSSVSASSEIAVDGGSNGYVSVPGNTNPALESQLVEDNYVTPDYFKTFGIPLLEGRTFTQQDMQSALNTGAQMNALFMSGATDRGQAVAKMRLPVIINEVMAKTFWPNQDPLGKSYTGQGGGEERIVIGVAGDERQQGIRQSSVPENYFPATVSYAFPVGSMIVGVKTVVKPRGVLGAIRADLRNIDSSVAAFHVRTMDEVIADGMQDATLQTFLLGAFAALALVLAAVGLYGVMSYVVTQRTHEIGVRMALGAQTGDVLRMVISQGAKLIFIGVAIGIAAALGLTRLLAASLFGVTATDPATFIGVAVLLVIVALAACYIPARRASRVDPMIALRYE